MPGISGEDQCSREYTPHMWLGEHFIHNTERKVKVGEWWYRGGRLDDEIIVAERWKGGKLPMDGQTDRQIVPDDKIPPELLQAMKSVSLAEDEAFRREAERQLGRPRSR